MKLEIGMKVIAHGHRGQLINEYMTDMWEVRLSSGCIVVPASEIELVDKEESK